MPITKTQVLIDKLEQLRTEIASTRQEIRILAELLGIGNQFDQALLKHQTQLESENRQRQQRRDQFRQEFLDRVTDTKVDCPPYPVRLPRGGLCRWIELFPQPCSS